MFGAEQREEGAVKRVQRQDPEGEDEGGGDNEVGEGEEGAVSWDKRNWMIERLKRRTD